MMPGLKNAQDKVTETGWQTEKEPLIQTEGGQDDGETSEYFNICAS